MSLLSIKARIPSTNSPKLWGGILVAIPTAIPIAPLRSKLGNFAGNTVGSSKESSKFFLQSIVSLSISSNSSAVIFSILASVYLIAAAESPSIDPKFPWPSTKRYL